MQERHLIWVTGAYGRLGSVVVEQLQRLGRQVIGLARSWPNTISGPYQHWSPTDLSSLQQLFEQQRPAAVVHCAAFSQPDPCERQPELSWQANVVLTERLAQMCAEQNVFFLFTSTDLVFSGTRGGYREADHPDPAMVYGRHKWAGERAICAQGGPALVCRLPVMLGRGAGQDSFFDVLVRKLLRYEQVDVFSDEYRSFLSLQAAAQGLCQLLLGQKTGLYHLAGTVRLSRYELAAHLCRLLDRPQNLLRACLRRQVATLAPRPKDVSLCCDRARRAGFVPPDFGEDLARALQICLQLESTNHNQRV